MGRGGRYGMMSEVGGSARKRKNIGEYYYYEDFDYEK